MLFQAHRASDHERILKKAEKNVMIKSDGDNEVGVPTPTRM
jgi:hypothetical protein